VPRLSCSFASFVVCFSFMGLAFAQSAPPANEWQPRIPRLRVGPFTGVAVPFGSVTPQLELHEATPLAYLIGGDLAWGPVLPLDFGIMAAAMLGLGEPSACPQPSRSCALAAGGQFALRARYYFRPEQRFTPWLGLGAGFEVFESTGQSSQTEAGLLFDDTTIIRRSSTYLGPLGILLAGVDYRVSRRFALGGLLALSLSPYLTVKDAVNVDGEDVTSSSGSLDPSLHQWLFVAVHLTFDQRL
jgi:hypothetical protein